MFAGRAVCLGISAVAPVLNSLESPFAELFEPVQNILVHRVLMMGSFATELKVVTKPLTSVSAVAIPVLLHWDAMKKMTFAPIV